MTDMRRYVLWKVGGTFSLAEVLSGRDWPRRSSCSDVLNFFTWSVAMWIQSQSSFLNLSRNFHDKVSGQSTLLAPTIHLWICSLNVQELLMNSGVTFLRRKHTKMNLKSDNFIEMMAVAERKICFHFTLISVSNPNPPKSSSGICPIVEDCGL